MTLSHQESGPRQWVLLFVVLALLQMPLVNLASTDSTPARAQPALLAMAEADPGSLLQVIVQQEPGSDLRARIGELGGQVLRELPMIGALVAELPARHIETLGRSGGVRWISLDAPTVETSGKGGGCGQCIDTSALQGTYVRSVRATELWNEPPYLQGQGITVAIVDSGINGAHADIRGAMLDAVTFNSATTTASDGYGHGTHIAGIIRGNGNKSRGAHIGMAPQVRLVNVKVSDDRGMATMSDVINGLQWILDNKDANNIRVVNVSLNSTTAESYHTSPLNAALEILWFNGIVVVVSAGNNGTSNSGVVYPPANDPFVITVGATDDRGTVSIADDTLAPFSAYGTTNEGFSKPEIVAPGTNIISLLSANNSELARGHPSYRVDGFAGGKDYYFRMSGTSTSAPVVAGAVALLLQDEPNLTPDQVKYRLMATARPFPQGNGAGYLDAYAAVHGTTTASANTGVAASQLLWTGSDPVTWGSVNWGSVNWGSVNWGSVNWGSVNWGSVNWGSTHWED